MHRVKCEDMRYPLKISEDFFNRQWWETFMQVKYDDLVSFQIEMLEYYDENEFE
jgi:hypothetical protein